MKELKKVLILVCLMVAIVAATPVCIASFVWWTNKVFLFYGIK